MADRKLGTDTTVTNRETGDSQTFPAGTSESDLPEWANIDNESAWATPPGGPESPEDVEEFHTGDYADYTVPQLIEMVNDRNLDAPANARKADLISVLEADDAS